MLVCMLLWRAGCLCYSGAATRLWWLWRRSPTCSSSVNRWWPPATWTRWEFWEIWHSTCLTFWLLQASHFAQRHASSHTVYQRQCLHSIIFLIMPNVMQAQTPFTRNNAFTQFCFSSCPTSCKLKHCLPETVPSLNLISGCFGHMINKKN